MHPSQINQVWELLQRSPEKASAMFGGAPLEAIENEIGGEKRKLDALMSAQQLDAELQVQPPSACPLATSRHDPATLNAFLRPSNTLNYAIYHSVRMRLPPQAMGVDGKRKRDRASWGVWLARYQQRLQDEGVVTGDQCDAALVASRRALTVARNPTFVLRNWVAQHAIEAAETV